MEPIALSLMIVGSIILIGIALLGWWRIRRDRLLAEANIPVIR